MVRIRFAIAGSAGSVPDGECAPLAAVDTKLGAARSSITGSGTTVEAASRLFTSMESVAEVGADSGARAEPEIRERECQELCITILLKLLMAFNVEMLQRVPYKLFFRHFFAVMFNYSQQRICV